MRALTLLCILGTVHGAVRLGTRRALQLKKTSVKQPVVLSEEVRRSMETAKALGQSVADFKSNYPQAQDASALVPDSGYSSWEKPAPVEEPLPVEAPAKAEASEKDDVSEMIARAQKAVSHKKRLDAQNHGDVKAAHKLLKTAEESIETGQSSSDSMSMEDSLSTGAVDAASTDGDTTDSVQEKQASDDNKEASSGEEQIATPEQMSAPDQQESNEGSSVEQQAAVPEKVVPAVASIDGPAPQQQGLDNFAGAGVSTQKLAATSSDVSDVVEADAASSTASEEAASKEDTVDSTAAEDQDTTVVSDENAAGTSEKQAVAVQADRPQAKDTGAKTDVNAAEEGTAIDDTDGVDQQTEESAPPIVEEEASSDVSDKLNARQEDPTVLDWYAQDPNDQTQPVRHEHVAI